MKNNENISSSYKVTMVNDERQRRKLEFQYFFLSENLTIESSLKKENHVYIRRLF